MPELRMVIPNISCSHCVNAITRELKAVDGVRSVVADAGTKSVRVEYDSPAGEQGITDILTELGYPPQEA